MVNRHQQPTIPQEDTGSNGEHLQIRLLGGFRVRIGGREIASDVWRLRKARNLIEILALAPAQQLAREQAIDLLWPELGSDAAANNLRYARHVARRILEAHDPHPSAETSFLPVQGDQLTLVSGSAKVWVDVVAFEEATATARRIRDEDAYLAALDLYTGDLLPDSYEEWVIDRRLVLRDTYAELLTELARIYERRGKLGLAAQTLQRAIDHDPASEVAHAALMRVFAIDGRRSQALRQYQTLRDALQRELDIEPDPVTQKLYADILANRFPPANERGREVGATTRERDIGEPVRPEAEAPRDNLPAPLTSFVGREAQVAAIRSQLESTRLLTLTGPGGAGKTRLAVEVASNLRERFPDGIWLIELAPINDRVVMQLAVAAVLGIHEEPGLSIIDAIATTLHDREALLVLDNCEHLLDACAVFATTLLRSCRRLCILATSREPLHVAGEMIWQVPPLELPDPNQIPSVPDIERVEAVRLFIERARFSHPGFALTERNAAAIVAICARLEGLPLAIELAAAWTRIFSVEQIVSLLDDNLRLLASEHADAHPRHRTLWATAEWSYNLLTDQERILFRRLSVFAGGCSLEGAQAACHVGDPSSFASTQDGSELGLRSLEEQDLEGDILVHLVSLVDKNLLVQEEQPDGELRFRMQEVIRVYALQRLEESGEADTIRRRHAAWLASLGEQARAAFDTPEAQRWLDRLERERNNYRAALTWAMDRADDQLRLRLVCSLYGFWYVRGPISAGAHWLEQALERTESAPAALHATAYYQAGEFARIRGEYGKAIRYGEESLRIAREVGDTLATARALFLLANTADSQGDHDRAITLYEECLSLSYEINDKDQIAITLNNLAETIRMQGDVDRATMMLAEALDLWRESGSKWGIGIALTNLGEIARHRGEYEEAERLTRESLAIMRELDDKWGIADALRNLSEIAVSLEQPERAARIAGAAQMLHTTIGVVIFFDDRQRDQRVIDVARAALGSEAFERAWQEGQAMTLDEVLNYALGESP